MFPKKMVVMAASGVLALAGMAAAPAATAQETGAAAACWTTFNPGNTQGGAFKHTYKNCNPKAIEVASGYDKDGQTHATTSCVRLAPQASVTWSYSSSGKGAQYKTIVCAYPA